MLNCHILGTFSAAMLVVACSFSCYQQTFHLLLSRYLLPYMYIFKSDIFYCPKRNTVMCQHCSVSTYCTREMDRTLPLANNDGH